MNGQDTARTLQDETEYPNSRPRDAATLILVDRTGPVPKVLVGKRHEKVVFNPGMLVFPGGRVDAADSAVPVAAPIPDALIRRLMQGSPKITASRAKALANAAIREMCEETGLCLGRKTDISKGRLTGSWKPFADAGLLPDPSSLYLIARAITPPRQVRRYDTRFFTADVSAITHRVPDAIHADAELVELLWVDLGAEPLQAMHAMTVRVLRQLEQRLAQGVLRHDAPTPFFHFHNGQMTMDLLP